MDATLSASKLHVLQSCSWLFYCRYGPWKLPQKSNDGARRGQCVHSLFECLLKPRHKKHYTTIIEKKTIKGLPLIERFIRTKMKSEGILGEHDHKNQNNFEMIDQMILVGLLYNFYCDDGKIEKAEIPFAYTNKEVGYTIRGLIDKISKHKNFLKIHDYKSSANVYEGEDLDSNVQAMIYSLYAKRVRNMNSIVKFIFLRFPDAPIQEVKFNETILNGFEQYLSIISKHLENFSLEDAYGNFAADKPFPKKGEGFKGPLLCGYSKYPGHKNKEGQEYWHCPYKWGFDYYALIDRNSKKVKKTAFTEKELSAKEGQTVEKRYYGGCPRYQNKSL